MSADPRYTIFAARAVFDGRLTAIDVRVLAALGTYSDRQGWCHPSQGTIAERCSVSRQSVITSIKRLVSFGYLQTVEQVTDKGRQVNVYRVLLDMIAPESALETAEPATAQVLDFPAVKSADSRLSHSLTGPDVAVELSTGTQDVDPPVNDFDSRLSTPVDTPCQPPLTAILDRARDPHKNIPKKETKRASRLPSDWTPRKEEIAFGVTGGLSEAEVLAAAAHMRDWAEAKGASKANWDLTFRNWLRTAITDAQRGRRPVVIGVAVTEYERQRRIRLYAHDRTWRDEWGAKPSQAEIEALEGAVQ